MRHFQIPLVLTAILLAILGALLHPFSLLLGLLPIDASGFEGFLQEARSMIADLLGWGVLGVLLSMLAYVALGRRFHRKSQLALTDWFSEHEPLRRNSHSRPKAV